MEVFLDRRSYREYKDEKIPEEDINKIVTAALYAPTAVNKREVQFVVIDDKKVMEEIMKVHPYSHMLKQASHAIAVVGNPKEAYLPGYFIVDASIASENILLAAETLGYGSVFLGVYPEEERVESIRKILQLPEGYVVLNVISLGVPTKKLARPERYDANKVHRNAFGTH